MALAQRRVKDGGGLSDDTLGVLYRSTQQDLLPGLVADVKELPRWLSGKN